MRYWLCHPFRCLHLSLQVRRRGQRFPTYRFYESKVARRTSRGTQFAIVSTQKALEDAQIDLHKEDLYRVGVCFGTSIGPADIYEKFFATFYERGLKKIHPLLKDS